MSYPCRTCHTGHNKADAFDLDLLDAMRLAIGCRAGLEYPSAMEAALAALDAIRLDHCIEPKPQEAA